MTGHRNRRPVSFRSRLGGLPVQVAVCLIAVMMIRVESGRAETAVEFVEPSDPQHLGLTLFGMGFGSPLYGTTHAGIELSASFHKYDDVF